MANYYMGLEPFTLTDIETIETKEYKDFKSMMVAATKNSGTIYAFDLQKVEKAITNFFNGEGYAALNTSDLSSVVAKINPKQFYIVGSSKERTCLYIKSKRTTRAQSEFIGLNNLFGKKATEEKIATFALGEVPANLEDRIMGICMAIENLRSQGHISWTLSGNALNDLKTECFSSIVNGKKMYGAFKFNEMFPKLEQEVHDYVFSSLQGGLCYFNPKYVGISEVSGTEYDVNSMYSSVMLDEFLPYGAPVYFEGKLDKPVINGKPVLHFQRIMIGKLRLMKDGIPCIRNKEEQSYYTEADNLTIVLSHIGLEMLFDNYDVEDLVYLDGYKFRGRKKMFDNYINKWAEQKKNAEEGSFERMYAKLMLNSAFGKFVSRTDRRSDEWVEIKFGSQKGSIVKRQSRNKDNVEGNSVYAPVGCYITDYARQRLINAIKANKDNFIYSDTDSIYVKGEAAGLELDAKKFGAWKEEFKFTKMNIIGKKQYCVLKTDGTVKVVLAGCPDHVTKKMTTFDDFFLGKEVEYDVKNFDLQGKAYLDRCKYVLKDEMIN